MNKVIASNQAITLSELSASDAPWIYDLMNDPLYQEFIGDRNIHTIEDAVSYLLNGPIASYRAHGFGLWKVTLNQNEDSIGICCIVQRDYLDGPDIGYATLANHRKKGLTYQAIQLTLSYFREHISSDQLYGLTKPDNTTSQQLLLKAGFDLLDTRVVKGLETVVYKLS